MKIPSLRQTAFAAVASIGAVLATPSSSQDVELDGQGGGPTVQVTHPNGVVSTIDCATLFTTPNPKKPYGVDIWGTCEFFEQTDYNNQEFCQSTDNIERLSPTDRVQALRQAARDAFIHFGRAHGDCVAYAARIEGYTKDDRALRKLYGDDYKTNTSCTLITAVQQCKAELGLD